MVFPWKVIIIVGSVWCNIRFKWKWVTRINNENKIVVCTSQGWKKIMFIPLEILEFYPLQNQTHEVKLYKR